MNPARDWLIASAAATTEHRQAVMRLLGCSCFYGIAPFVPMQADDGWRLAACLSPPSYLDGAIDWEPSGDVVLIGPKSGAVQLVGDSGGWIVGDISPFQNTVKLYTDGLRFARDWAAARAEWLDLNRRSTGKVLEPREPLDSGLPGFLLAGSLASVCHWSPLMNRERIETSDAATATQLRQALLAAARLPQVSAKTASIREAA